MLRELPRSNPEFFAELTRGAETPLPALTADEIESEDMQESAINDPGDDCAVPLEAVEDALHGVLPTDSDQVFVSGSDGLLSAAEAEDTLVESVNGIVIDTSSVVQQVLGRGQRKKFPNNNYLAANFDFTHDLEVPDY